MVSYVFIENFFFFESLSFMHLGAWSIRFGQLSFLKANFWHISLVQDLIWHSIIVTLTENHKKISGFSISFICLKKNLYPLFQTTMSHLIGRQRHVQEVSPKSHSGDCTHPPIHGLRSTKKSSVFSISLICLKKKSHPLLQTTTPHLIGR